jgi:CDP-4-dehydro-6-deoxyglucose reductase
MSFQVQLQPSGHAFSVDTGETILAAALRHGVMLPYGCRVGRCGACMATLRAGSIAYQGKTPPGLEPDELAANKILVCQAHPESDLVLETRELARAGDIQIKNLPARVHDLLALTHDIMRVRLKLPASERLQFMAGQYIEILLKDGRRRAFSSPTRPTMMTSSSCTFA